MDAAGKDVRSVIARARTRPLYYPNFVFIFAYMALVKCLPIITIVWHYRHWPIFYQAI